MTDGRIRGYASFTSPSTSSSIEAYASRESPPATRCRVRTQYGDVTNPLRRLLVAALVPLLICAWCGLAIAKKTACEHGVDCSKYECDKKYGMHTPVDYFAKPGRSIFTRPCRCQADWNAHFCMNSAKYRLSTIDDDASLPSVCICRQFSDPGEICKQFMTQCFSGSKPDEPCYCCFNQPGAYCNQVPCSKGQPEFGPKSNTTCVCHLPSVYPYHICTLADLQSTANVENSLPSELPATGNTSVETDGKSKEDKKLALLGFELSANVAFTIVLSLLGAVALLTVLLLVVRSCRLHKQRHHDDARRNNAQTILLQQRAEDDKYLP